jgi:hypothetical protein
MGGEPYGVIGGDKLGYLTSQPPDRAYWTALRTWGLLAPAVHHRWEAMRRLRNGAATKRDDDGAPLDEDPSSVFVGLPREPKGWNDPSAPLQFRLESAEQEFLKSKLKELRRPDGELCLLARLVAAGDSFDRAEGGLPLALDASADAADRRALAVARDAAQLAAIGRAVYGALVEELRRRDGAQETGFRHQLRTHFDLYGDAATACNLDALEALLPSLPVYMRNVLRETREFVREGRPDRFGQLRDGYAYAETKRKTPRRARLGDTSVAAQRRAEWDPDPVKQTRPLHYRWDIVRDMLADLGAR